MASASVFTEPRWYPPIPSTETSRPVRPSGRLSTSAPDCPCAPPPAAPSISASIKILLVTSNPGVILFCRRVRMPSVVCHFEHLSRLNLLHVDWKSMSEARLGVIELERQFVELESAISRILPAAIPQRLHRRRLHRRKTLRYFERLLKGFLRIDARNRS